MSDQPIGPIETLLIVDDDVVRRMGGLIRHLCVGMIDESVRVTVLGHSSDPTLADRVGPARTVMLPRRLLPWHRPSAAAVLEIIGGQVPDLVHCLSADLARWFANWAEDWGCPIISTLCDHEDIDQFCSMTAADRLSGFATTPSVRNALIEQSPELESRISVVPLGLPAEQEPRCGGASDRIATAVVTAPLSRNSGLDVVFKAMKIVVQDHADLHLFVLSTGKAEDYFRRQVEDPDLRARVTFAGEMSDWTTLRTAMAAADFYIIPGTSGRFTASNLTALACGLAILAPEGSMEDYLIDAKTAVIFEPRRPKDLAQKWLALLQDRESAMRLAQGALDHARSCHQASRMVAETAAHYRRLCGIHTAPVDLAAGPF
ncbi:MAG TPA: glycosyltransferase family 4 protein [Phycisphaerae bacterium]|nr:glycosyltransferase family 4 protein [Phycisphaerae bacterium]HRY69506.1 glycosyltransferase family 4 protein [Phycisphaerae bacterium]HSA28190.1 glycosyltransferase family 4 protein [Phycisphaerae bacterium]